MEKISFRHMRVMLDLTVAETAKLLTVSESVVAQWQSGEQRIPDWVEHRLRQMREAQLEKLKEYDVRQAIEERYGHLCNHLYLAEVPDGWLAIAEHLLKDIDARIPDAFRASESFGLDFKEKWGSLQTTLFLDVAADLVGGQKFWDWARARTKAAEEESVRTCARCGGTQDVKMTCSGWILPLCNRHRLIKEEVI